MSKRVKLITGILVIVVIVGVTAVLLSPKKKLVTPESEIAIKGRTTSSLRQVEYLDSSGFKFSYPDELEVKEIELEDQTIYSSLELTKNDGERGKLKIADTDFKDLESWQTQFEQTEVVNTSKLGLWVDIPSLEITFGAPEKLVTVAIENGIIYWLETPSANYWFETQKIILNSFEFLEKEVVETQSETEINEDSDIILLEEEVIE